MEESARTAVQTPMGVTYCPGPMEVVRRRVLSVSGVAVGAFVLTVLLPIWVPLVVLADLARGKRRLPLARLFAFGLGWAWLETVSVIATVALWLARRHRDLRVHYALQRWWADRLMRLLTRTTGIRVEATGADALLPGPVIVLCRHASLADSLVSAWVITTGAGLRPRYVLKRELLADPCLDIVGNRLPTTSSTARPPMERSSSRRWSDSQRGWATVTLP